MEKDETRKEKLARLLAENKTRLARDKLVDKYSQEIKYPIASEQFLNLTTSHEMKRNVYKKVSTLSGIKFKDFYLVSNFIKDLRRRSTIPLERVVMFYYMDTNYTGGLSVQLKVCWDILDQIKIPVSDIIVTKYDLAFGLCIEIEEYDYTLTYWGLDNITEA